MPADFKYDVFLSHDAQDKLQVRRLAERLKAAGLRVWFDEWVIKPGDIVGLKVDEGLIQSRVLLLCISPAALESEWVAKERYTVIHRDPANAGRRFVPILLGDCQLPETLRLYKYVDFRRESEAAVAEVLMACRIEIEEVWRSAVLPPVHRETEGGAGAKPTEQRRPPRIPERPLRGHKSWVNSVAVSPDGKWVASGSQDMTVRIWDLETGECRTTLDQWGPVKAVAISSDGKLILSSSEKAVHVWDAVSGNKLSECSIQARTPMFAFRGNDSPFTAIDSALRLWDLSSCECVHEMVDMPYRILCCTINQAGSEALSGHEDGVIRLWNFETGKCLATLKGHSGDVLSVNVTPDGKLAVSGSSDRTVKVWDLEARICVGTFEGHHSSVQSVTISPDGKLIASAAEYDQTVRLWVLDRSACIEKLPFEWGMPQCVAFDPDCGRLLVGINELICVVSLWNIRGISPSEEARRYVNAKVVLLGEGTVGKTSLAHRLIGDEYVISDRTHGMNVWRLDIPFSPNALLEREVLLWDMAGQEDYRLIHQLFLEETALALLLINPQKEDPFVEAGDWLKALKTAVGDSAGRRDAGRLLIFSQTDVGGMKLGNTKIDRFRKQHGFSDWLPTSAKTGANCSDRENGGQPSKLKQLIAASIPWDKLPWTSTPRLLAELKNAVMTMRDRSDVRLLRFSELAQRLEQALPGEKFAEPEIRTAVTLLANHGLARPLKFGDLVLLRPDLINGYAGAVIRAARAHSDEIGCVPEEDIYRPDFDFTGVERLAHRPDEELLLRALVQTFLDHSLCIAEETPHGRHLVFPSQYRRERDLPHEPDIFVSYSFSGEWQTVWTTLVVRLWYSQEFEHRELWRNAAEFESARKQTLGLKITKTGDGAATISLYFDREVPDELKVIFIEYVHRHLAKYACEVTRDRRYVCSTCGTPVKDLDAVRRRRDAKKEFITCQECDEKVPFIDFIEQRLKSDPVARRILAMDETATRELDTQALEQILIGHMMAIAGEANQIFRPVAMSEHGIDGEVEFKDNDGRPSGRKICVQLKIGSFYRRLASGFSSRQVFDVKDERHLEYWISRPVDVYLVIRQTDEASGQQVIRWMNVTRYLNARKDKKSRQIIFDGEKLDMEAMWKVRDRFFPPNAGR